MSAQAILCHPGACLNITQPHATLRKQAEGEHICMSAHIIQTRHKCQKLQLPSHIGATLLHKAEIGFALTAVKQFLQITIAGSSLFHSVVTSISSSLPLHCVLKTSRLATILKQAWNTGIAMLSHASGPSSPETCFPK